MEHTKSCEITSNGKYFSFYLPHHAVVKPDKVTTKVRVVFNASQTSGSRKSQNEVLRTGPTLQPDLMFLMLQWRTHRFVFNGDIEKMYRQILIHDYNLKTVTFGVNCAPYIAIRGYHHT
ncbi:PREDICTED: uncharacterized protein LOC108368027 [Rhagoletis zephyria]|uniref:uncharacterized protein LOC108368027 n=1 Tax=Rhagoletis zephyria TaxID=28612 RepID=UPI0008118A03|nr:PREDICTED: uncharacterized protein LOC108368027 [Rhagoletis zephyria]